MPYIRCQVFVIGMVIGWFLQKKKDLQINKASTSVIQNFIHKLCYLKLINIIMWMTAFACLGIALFGLKDWVSGHLWNMFPRAMYSAFGRPLWALGLSWIVVACFYGYGGKH
ncbi:unnamed protein product [Strongylus vulgaris]|uniref:Uncharacterized protein n=1 Tax=Strongylus vulgaris TaxID=40348 RepID=A0A3P7J8P3_STRVU|nr:unnamed protein product [Strongylus vulgaris]